MGPKHLIAKAAHPCFTCGRRGLRHFDLDAIIAGRKTEKGDGNARLQSGAARHAGDAFETSWNDCVVCCRNCGWQAIKIRFEGLAKNRDDRRDIHVGRDIQIIKAAFNIIQRYQG